MEPQFLEPNEIDTSGLLDPSLRRANFWSDAPALMQMWAAFTHHFQTGGTLRELVIRATTDSHIQALAVTAGVKPPDESADTESVNGPAAASGGFMHFLPPFQVQETITMTSMLVRLPPWFSPLLGGFIAHSERDLNDRMWFVTYEQPLQLLAESRSDRWANERLHLDRYCTDFLLRHGESPYERIERGGEPPDFLCSVGDAQRGVECTQMTVAERRQAFGLFKRVRAAVTRSAEQSRSRFAALRGLAVYMRFEGLNGQPEFPPAASDAAAVAEIVDELAKFRPEIDPTWVPSGPLPEQAPPVTIARTNLGCSFHAAPLMNALPDTPFFTSTGFELGFGLQTVHRPESAWRQLAEIIERKDRVANDELIITAGGPDRDGYSYPSE